MAINKYKYDESTNKINLENEKMTFENNNIMQKTNNNQRKQILKKHNDFYELEKEDQTIRGIRKKMNEKNNSKKNA